MISVLHGDCLELMPRMDAESVDCAITSPPYNQLGSRIPANPSGIMRDCQWIEKVNRLGYFDDAPEDEYQSWLVTVASEIRRVLVPGGSFFFNHKLRYRDKTIIHPLDIVRMFDGFSLRQEIVWDRRGSFVFNARMMAPSDERIYWLYRDDGDFFWNQEAAGFLSVWPIPSNRHIKGSLPHACPFPEEIPRRCMVAGCPPGGTVLDPFMGIGTTGLAAKFGGYGFVGIESDRDSYETAKRRIGGIRAETPLLQQMAGAP